uniref:Nuclear pore complex protein Nup133 n=3 Tax=Cacopsylla melanoneura TaxID=428564 RepID=A0A8D8YPU1_9HEMI
MNSSFSRSFQPQTPRTPTTFSPTIKGFSGTRNSFLTPTRISGRGSLSGISNQNIQVVYKSSSHVVEKFGSFLPVIVKEAIKHADRNSQMPSCHISDSGWAWFVLGRRLLIWQNKAKDNQCRELELPGSDLAHRTSLVCVFTAQGGTQACIAVSPEGNIRYWPSINHAEMSFDDNTDLQGQECDCLHYIPPLGFVLVTTTASLVLITPRFTCGRTQLQVRKFKQSSGWLGGFGQKFSILFGTPQTQTQETKLVKMITKRHGALALRAWQVIVIAGHSLQKWILSPDDQEKLVYDTDLSLYLQDNYLKTLAWDSRNADVVIIDAHLNGVDIILLIATKNSSLSPLANFAFMTLNIEESSDLPSARLLGVKPVSNVDWASLLSDHSSQQQRELKPVRLLIHQGTPIVYNQRYIVPILGDSEDQADLIDLGPSPEFHILEGAILKATLPVFFSRHYGFVSLLPADVNPDDVFNCSTNMSSLDVMSNDILALSEADMEKLGKENDNKSKMKAAFLQFVSNNFVASEQILKESFPSDLSVPYLTDAPLDSAVVLVARSLIDDIPAKDPRWAEIKNMNDMGMSVTISLDISLQLDEKRQVMEWYVGFLRESGLWSRLAYSTLHGVVMATTYVLADCVEKILAAITLRKLHKQLPQLMEKNIDTVVTARKIKSVSSGLTSSDLFYREVSQVHILLQTLVSHADTVLHSAQSAHTKVSTLAQVGSVLLETLRAVTAYRRNKEEAFQPCPHVLNKSSEYLPWTSASDKDGIYSELMAFHKILLHATTSGLLSSLDSPELVNTLHSDLLSLVEFLLDSALSYVNSLGSSSSLKTEQARERFERDRFALIEPFLLSGQDESAHYLAEKYRDYEILLRLSDSSGNTSKLANLINKFQEDGFVRFIYEWFVDNSKAGQLLDLLAESDDLIGGPSKPGYEVLRTFLTERPQLAWIYAIRTREYAWAGELLFSLATQERSLLTRKKIMLCQSKLCCLRCGSSSPCTRDDTLASIDLALQVIAHQESIPEATLAQFGYAPDTVKVFTVPEIIRMKTCLENSEANEFSFTSALDLLDHVDKEEDRSSLLMEVWIMTILRDEERYTRPLENSEDAGQVIQELMFFKVVDAIVRLDSNLASYLPPLSQFLECNDLPDTLTSSPQFKYLMELGYEHVSQALKNGYSTAGAAHEEMES